MTLRDTLNIIEGERWVRVYEPGGLFCHDFFAADYRSGDKTTLELLKPLMDKLVSELSSEVHISPESRKSPWGHEFVPFTGVYLRHSSPSYSCVIPIDPSTLSTAQQKKISFKTHRVFTNKRVEAGMRSVALLARQHTKRVVAAVPHGTPVSLEVTFFYTYPKGTPMKRLVDGAPMPTGADLDNRFKSFGDALTRAGWWADDRAITSLLIKKRRTTNSPRVEITVKSDC